MQRSLLESEVAIFPEYPDQVFARWPRYAASLMATNYKSDSPTQDCASNLQEVDTMLRSGLHFRGYPVSNCMLMTCLSLTD